MKKQNPFDTMYDILMRIFIISLPFFVIFGTAQLIAYNPHYYDAMASFVGSSVENKSMLNKEVASFLSGNSDDLSEVFTEHEKAHLYDVRAIFHILLFFFLFLLIANATIVTFLFRTSTKRKQMFSYLLKRAGIFSLIVSVVFFVGSIFFNAFFKLFHIIFFKGDSWLFEADDIIVLLYPYDFFRFSFILIMIVSFLIGVLLFIIGMFMSGKLSCLKQKLRK